MFGAVLDDLRKDLSAAFEQADKLEHSVALYMMSYNFCRIHKTLRVTPAMEAGISDRVWAMEEVVDLIDACAANSK